MVLTLPSRGAPGSLQYCKVTVECVKVQATGARTRLTRSLFEGTPDARTLADDARPSIPASRRDDSASTVVLSGVSE